MRQPSYLILSIHPLLVARKREPGLPRAAPGRDRTRGQTDGGHDSNTHQPQEQQRGRMSLVDASCALGMRSRARAVPLWCPCSQPRALEAAGSGQQGAAAMWQALLACTSH